MDCPSWLVSFGGSLSGNVPTLSFSGVPSAGTICCEQGVSRTLDFLSSGGYADHPECFHLAAEKLRNFEAWWPEFRYDTSSLD